MYIKRDLESLVKKASKGMPIVAVLGPRQSGKTTFIKHLFKKKMYFNLEDPRIRTMFKNDPTSIFESHKNGFILDEVQRMPEIFSYLQVYSDKINKNGLYIISGSQNYLINQSISQSLAGRVALFSLLPFSICEIRKMLPSSADHLMFKGFYPRIYSSKVSPKIFYSSYIQTYVERDVRLLQNIKDLHRFEVFLSLCAGRIGQLLDISDLADSTGISRQTAKDWLSILEASFIIFLLRPYYKNYNKRLIKTPKLYFWDVGMVLHLLGITDPKQIFSYPLKGELFENMVISDIHKNIYNGRYQGELYFWRSRDGLEIDILLVNGNKILPIEIKSSMTFRIDFLNNIDKFRKYSGIDRAVIIYQGNNNFKIKNVDIINYIYSSYSCKGWNN